MDRGAEIRDESYQKAAKEVLEEAPLSSSLMEIAYTPLDLIIACQTEVPEEENNRIEK